MTADRYAIPRLQSDFYRDQFRRILRWLMFSMATIIALILAIIYLLFLEPLTPYYANTSEGKILVMPPVAKS
jgi:hypothetical protein